MKSSSKWRLRISREGQAGINIQVFNVGVGASRGDAQTVRVKLKPLRTREELIADLQKRDPELFATMTQESLTLLKGGQADKAAPEWAVI